MSRGWKAGDVAMVHVSRWPEARTWPDDTSAVLMRMDEHGYMIAVAGDPSAPFAVPKHLVADYVRPLVLIDPDNREQVESLMPPNWHRDFETIDHFQDHVRSLADTAPTKPAEPLGLGAVVEDADGVKWARSGGRLGSTAWHSAHADWVAYKDISAVTVLNEGVPA